MNKRIEALAAQDPELAEALTELTDVEADASALKRASQSLAAALKAKGDEGKQMEGVAAVIDNLAIFLGAKGMNKAKGNMLKAAKDAHKEAKGG